MSKFYKDTKHKYEYKVNKRVITCKATTNYKINNSIFKISSKGKAKCNPTDKFDYYFGCELAKARAKQKLAEKIENLLMQYSYDSSVILTYMNGLKILHQTISNSLEKLLGKGKINNGK